MCLSLLSYNAILVPVVFPALFYRVISSIVNGIEESIESSSLLKQFKMSELPALQAKFIELVELLVNATLLNKSSNIDFFPLNQHLNSCYCYMTCLG